MKADLFGVLIATTFLAMIFLAAPIAEASLPIAEASLYDKAQALTLEGLSAKDDGHYSKATQKLEAALLYRPNHPGLVFYLALTNASDGKSTEALAWLHHYAHLGFTADLKNSEALKEALALPAYRPIQFQLEKNKSQYGSARTTLKSSEKILLVESLARDPNEDRWFLGSIFERKIVTAAPDGTISPFADETSGLWSAMGMKVDAPRALLWVASAVTPQTGNIFEEEWGKSAVFAYDLKTGTLKGTWHLPSKAADKTAGGAARGDAHWFGDLVLLPDGSLIISDSLSDTLYQIDKGTGPLEDFLSHEDFPSPQGLTLSDDGRYLFLADYAMGLFRIDISTKEILRLQPSDNFAPYGIDGLYTHGSDLIAIQNGTRPQRIIRIELNENKDAIENYEVLAANHPDFLEPTLGEVVGDTFHFIANSGWPLFNPTPDPIDKIRAEMPHTLIMEINLTKE
jgi:tetratricopeptide (TPR) repeat protein